MSSQMVAVVSDSFVRRYWPDSDPIGRTFTIAFSERTVVGVVGDIRVRGLERPSEPQVYLPYRQVEDGSFTFYAPKELVVRTSTDPSGLTPAIRRIVREADPDLPLARIRTLADVVDTQTAPRVTQLRVLQAFALLSLLLAGIGIHGLLAYAVSERRAEIGLRVALGAKRSSILTLIRGPRGMARDPRRRAWRCRRVCRGTTDESPARRHRTRRPGDVRRRWRRGPADDPCGKFAARAASAESRRVPGDAGTLEEDRKV